MGLPRSDMYIDQVSSPLSSISSLLSPPPQSHRLGRSCPDRPDRSRSCIRPLSDRLISHFSLFLFVFFFGWKAGGGSVCLPFTPLVFFPSSFSSLKRKKKEEQGSERLLTLMTLKCLTGTRGGESRFKKWGRRPGFGLS